MKQKSIHGLQSLALLVALALTGCGGGGGGGSTTPATPTTGDSSVVYAVRDVAPASACPNGGISVDAGIDTNRNGVLDPSEITSTQYVCNGANGSTGPTGPAGPAGPGITWEGVTATSVQAVPNRGYMTNSPSQVTVTLPVSPAVGDIVRVSGIGAGGWKIAQNAGQSVITRDIDVWTPHGPARSWTSIASSAEGTKLVAAENSIGSSRIFTSLDSGQTWTSNNNSPVANWQSVASSADGVKLVAVVSGGFIFTSTDSGAIWTQRATNQPWSSVASSSDGTKLVATLFPGKIFTSTDSGLTWNSTNDSPATNWQSVASSSDGTKLVAVENVPPATGGLIYTSADSGVTWTPRDSVRSWQSVASSADGSKLVAVVNQGLIYTSVDSGVNWTPHAVSAAWAAVASSSDGTKLVAVAGTTNQNGFGEIYLSNDSGLTWKPQGQFITWQAVASSSDGNILFAAPNGTDFIRTFRGATTVGIAGSITGSQYDAVELQYIGGNLFTVLSHSGSLVVQ